MKLANDLSHYEIYEMFDIVRDCLQCNKITDFLQITKNRIKLLVGFSQAIFISFKKQNNKLGKPTSEIININYPKEWVSSYMEKRLWEIDPLIKRGITKSCFQFWHDTFSTNPPPNELKNLSSKFGFLDGLACSTVNKPFNDASLIIIADKNIKDGKRSRIILEALMPYLHIAHESIIRNKSHINYNGGLSLRECEILNWLRNGKTSWEISVILEITERTVNFHVSNIKRKLNAINRQQAVAAGIDLGIINCNC